MSYSACCYYFEFNELSSRVVESAASYLGLGIAGPLNDLAASEAIKKAALEAPMPAVGLPAKDDDAKPIDDDTKDDA